MTIDLVRILAMPADTPDTIRLLVSTNPTQLIPVELPELCLVEEQV